MLAETTAKSKTYIDFFSGCGGLSLGLGWAGWNGVFGIEKDPMAFESFKRNLIDQVSPNCHFSKWPKWLSQKAHAIEDILEDASVMNEFLRLSGRITLVAGGPPCQGFSVAGARNGNDPRNLLVFKLIKAISILRPLFAIVENVEGFEKKFVNRPGTNSTVSVASEAIEELSKIGYSVGKIVINAADFGVPQLRRRVLFANGWIDDPDGRVLLYYASSDTRLHVAESSVERLLDWCFHTPPDRGRTAFSVEDRLALIRKNRQ